MSKLNDGSIVSTNAEAGVCGLRNLGNTCFMNAGIQCLIATAPLAIALAKGANSTSHPLTASFSALIRKMWSGRYSSVHPVQFRQAMVTLFPQFNDYRQHDCQEFLALLLDALHEQLNTAGSKDIGCQVEPTELKEKEKVKSLSVKRELQSTSKGNGEHAVNAETEKLMNNVKEKKVWLNKSTSTEVSCLPEPNVDKDNNSMLIDNLEKPLNNTQNLKASLEELSVVQNPVKRLTGFNDILKEAKMSNLNVLVQKEAANNEIKFDSDKYPKSDASRRRGEVFNQNTLQFDYSSYGKRNSNISLSYDFNDDGLDLKRVKLHSSSEEDEKNKRMELERQQDSPDLFLEKNERLECEIKEGIEVDILSEQIDNSLLSPPLPDIKFDQTSEVEAEKHWQKHLACNRSVVVDTFQGQFKSTVICSVCKFISVTYEPFMYLSVPLPNAMQRRLREYQTISVTFVGESLKHPTKISIDLNKHDTVSYLRDQILLKVSREVKGPIVIAEVLDHHVSKFLGENLLVQFINDTGRSIYAFEVSTLLDYTTIEPLEEIKAEDYQTATSCVICLEDKDTNMKQHESCSFIICESCIAATCNHYGSETFCCPICRQIISSEESLKPLTPLPDYGPRMMNIPVVFRVDTVGDGNNNQKNIKVFGHPMVIRVPSRCSSEGLKKELSSIIHYKEPYRLLLVDGQGLYCSRCMFNSHCRGCELPEEVSFKQSDSLAIVFSSPVQNIPTISTSAVMSTQSSALTLYDCIQAFSQSEVLDANNPWFCPKCKQNRCATKTLSVWRYPDYLIVYLKRFVFHNASSTKLDEKVLFPLNGLSLASGTEFNLYACVCHSGGISGGHYTTYTQHPYTEQWHFFNDSIVSKQSPLEEDCNAYILFYKKQGLKPPPIQEALGVLHGES